MCLHFDAHLPIEGKAVRRGPGLEPPRHGAAAAAAAAAGRLLGDAVQRVRLPPPVRQMHADLGFRV